MARMGEMIRAYMVFVSKPEVERPLEIPRRRREDNNNVDRQDTIMESGQE